MQLLILLSMASRKRVYLPLKDKIKLIKKTEQHGITQASVAKEFGGSTFQASRLVKANEDILKQFEAGQSHRKHIWILGTSG